MRIDRRKKHNRKTEGDRKTKLGEKRGKKERNVIARHVRCEQQDT